MQIESLKEEDVFSFRVGRPQIPAAGASVFGISQKCYLIAHLQQRLVGPVGAAVVHNDDIVIKVSPEGEKGIYGVEYNVLVVSVENDDGKLVTQGRGLAGCCEGKHVRHSVKP